MPNDIVSNEKNMVGDYSIIRSCYLAIFDPPLFWDENWGKNVNFPKPCHVIEENSEARVLQLHKYVKQVGIGDKNNQNPSGVVN